MWEYISFIDLGGPRLRDRNRGDYKLENVASVFFWSRKSVLVWLGPLFIDN
jgi:hypothetical protein